MNTSDIVKIVVVLLLVIGIFFLAKGNQSGKKQTEDRAKGKDKYGSKKGGKPNIPASSGPTSGTKKSPIASRDKQIQSSKNIPSTAQAPIAIAQKVDQLGSSSKDEGSKKNTTADMDSNKTHVSVISSTPKEAQQRKDAVSAACDGDLAIMARLIEEGYPINSRSDGQTVLHYASRHGREDMVSFLLEAGADLEVADDYGNTPLITACGENNLAIVKLLVTAGANVNHRNQNDSTPLSYVCGNTPLILAKNIALLLLDNGADVNAVDGEGNTPLFEACKRGLTTVKFLVERGADIQIKNKKGDTALRYAEANDHVDIVQYLLNLGIKQSPKVDFVLFLLESFHAPNKSAYDICVQLLHDVSPNDKLGRAYVIGRTDRFSADVAMSIYKEYVGKGQIPKLAGNAEIVEFPKTKGIALLFRVARE